MYFHLNTRYADKKSSSGNKVTRCYNPKVKIVFYK